MSVQTTGTALQFATPVTLEIRCGIGLYTVGTLGEHVASCDVCAVVIVEMIYDIHEICNLSIYFNEILLYLQIKRRFEIMAI